MNKENLIQQLQDGNFKKLNFTIFNYLDDNGYIIEINNFYKKKHGIEDMQFMLFTINESEKKAIKNNRKEIMNNIYDFKYDVERNFQKEFAICRIYVIKELGIIIAVKPKLFDISSLFINQN